VLLMAAFLIISCDSVSTNSGTGNSGSDNQNDNDNGSEWLIPEDQIFSGAGRDEIPSIDNPSFISTGEVTFMKDDELILGIKIGGEGRGYPHQILNYHEIVNDKVADTPVAVTFCPLTGSGMAWNRTVEGQEVTFGVSGLIHKNNLIAYDRESNNFWSQMLERSVKGSLQGQKTGSYQIIEMNWATWKEAFPESKILSGETGFDRNYTIYPYGGNYDNDHNNIVFPIHREDDRLQRKTLAHGLFYDTTLHVFPVEEFPNDIGILNRNFAGNDVVVAGSSGSELVVSFSRIAEDGTVLNFSESENELPSLLTDNEGNEWNVFGECISGPREGEVLNRVRSYNAYWFAWVDFFGDGPRSPLIVSP
jgi:hypothetical protein